MQRYQEESKKSELGEEPLARQLTELRDSLNPPPEYLHKLIMGRVEMDFIPSEYQKGESHALVALGLVFLPAIAFCLYLASTFLSGTFLGGPRLMPFFRLAWTGSDLLASMYRLLGRSVDLVFSPEPLVPGLVATVAILIIVYFTGHIPGNKEVKSC